MAAADLVRPQRNGAPHRDDEVYNAIREGILEGRYRPGDRLVESRLAEEHNVSRTKIRDCLTRLTAELLVAPAGRRGVVVRQLTSSDIEDIYALRLLLEGYAARMAAANITSEELRALEEVNSQIIALEQEGKGRVGAERLETILPVTDLNNQFHRIIQEASRNSRLTQIVRSVVDVPLVFKSFYWYSDLELAEAADDHRKIIEALRARDADRAEELMKAHITRGLNTLRREMPRSL